MTGYAMPFCRTLQPDGSAPPSLDSVSKMVTGLAYSALTWLLDKIMRLLSAGAFKFDVDAADKIVEEIFGAVFDKYKVLSQFKTPRTSISSCPYQTALAIPTVCNTVIRSLHAACCSLHLSVEHPAAGNDMMQWGAGCSRHFSCAC